MSDFKVFQAQIVGKDPVTPRAYTVVVIPSGQKLVGVQLPNSLKDQSTPLLNSIVLVCQLDVYKSYILQVLREPYDFLTLNSQYRGFIPSTGDLSTDISVGANPLQDGEIYMESSGPQSPNGQITPGFGASLYLGNNGCAQIQSGLMGERLIVGGTSSDNDHEVILSGANGFIESNSTPGTMLQSTYNWDNLNNITLGNQITIKGADTVIPVAEMTIDALGNIELFNTTYGTGIPLASLIMDSVGNISLTGTTINLNHGTFGAARLNDTTLANPTTDPAFWQFWLQQAAIFAAIPDTGTPPEPVASALKAAMVALLNAFPQSITGKISSASGTVTIGN